MPRFTRCNTNGCYTQPQLDCLNERYEICLRKVRHRCDREALREYVAGVVKSTSIAAGETPGRAGRVS